MKTYIFIISFFILSISAFCQESFKYLSIDYVAYEIRMHPAQPSFYTLTQSLHASGYLAEVHIKYLHANNKKIRMVKIETAYRTAQQNVNNYLDSLISGINACPKRMNYYPECNTQLKNALYSCNKLNKLFKKEIKNGTDNVAIIINQKASIEIVITEALTWKNRFEYCMPAIESEQYINALQSAYWKKWDDIK